MAKKGPGGFSDEVVKDKTGKSSKDWYQLLEKWGAKEKGHTLTAKYLREKYGISPWWSQAVTVRYEYKKGIKK